MADDQKPTKRLSLKQRKFCLAYVGEANGDGFEAAKLAGYAAKNDNTLRVIASQNLRKPAIKEFIAELRADAEREAGRKIMTSTQVLIGMSEVATNDIADIFESDGSFDLTKAKERGVSKHIKSVARDPKTGEWTKIEVYSSYDAKRDLGKHHGLFPTRITITDSDADKLIEEAIKEHGLPGGDDDEAPASESEYQM